MNAVLLSCARMLSYTALGSGGPIRGLCGPLTSESPYSELAPACVSPRSRHFPRNAFASSSSWRLHFYAQSSRTAQPTFQSASACHWFSQLRIYQSLTLQRRDSIRSISHCPDQLNRVQPSKATFATRRHVAQQFVRRPRKRDQYQSITQSITASDRERAD